MTLAKRTLSLLLSSVLALFLFSTQSVAAEEQTGLGALSGLAEKAGAMAESGNLGELFNINNASTEMLSQIPGIGEKLGQAITAYRDANGPFNEIKDLLNVDGIDMSLLEKIKPFLQI